MNEIQINPNPTPVPEPPPHGNQVYPWDELEKGQSFSTNSDKVASLRNLVHMRNVKGVKRFILRKTPTGCTVWRTLALAAAAVSFVGCASVPATRISFNPVTKELIIQSPKDVEMTNLSATIGSNGNAIIMVGGYVSKNNSEVINAISTQNANTWKAVSDMTAKIADTAIQATGKAVKP